MTKLNINNLKLIVARNNTTRDSPCTLHPFLNLNYISYHSFNPGSINNFIEKENYFISEAYQIKDFFKHILIKSETSSGTYIFKKNKEEIIRQEGFDFYVQSDLSNYFEKQFLLDYNYFIFDSKLNPNVDFKYIYLFFYTNTSFLIDNNLEFSHDINSLWSCIELSAEDLNIYISDYINAYTNNVFSLLNTNLDFWLDQIIAKLVENETYRNNKDKFNDTYINIILSKKKINSLTEKNKVRMYNIMGIY